MLANSGKMTALEYMEKQAEKCRRNYDRAMERGATVGELVNIMNKTSYYDQAVEALKEREANETI